MTTPLLSIENLSKTYHFKGKEPVNALRNVSLILAQGEFLSIVGESGSGKSTLIKIASRLESQDGGSVVFSGTDLSTLKGEHLRLHRQDVQLLFQDTTSSLNPKMTVENIITEPLRNFKLISKKDKSKVATQFLEKVELDSSFLKKKPKEMSGGQRQRIGIARALTLNPKLLLLDEPTSALDVITQGKILSLLKNLQKSQDLTILFVCHDIALVTEISDRIAVMHNGELLEILQPEDILSKKRHPYTQNLVHSVFDAKKCGCRFTEDCEHTPFFLHKSQERENHIPAPSPQVPFPISL